MHAGFINSCLSFPLSGSGLQTSAARSWSHLLVHPRLSSQAWLCRRLNMDHWNYWWEGTLKNTFNLSCEPSPGSLLCMCWSLADLYFAECPFGATDGGVHQAGADGVCHWAASSEEDKTRGTFHSVHAHADQCDSWCWESMKSLTYFQLW